MNKVEIFDTYLPILDELMCLGFEEFLNTRTKKAYMDWNRSCDYGSTYCDYCEIASGATKLVIIADNSDYVLKIPFSDYVDHCELEAENYHLAQKEGVEWAFAECDFLFDFANFVNVENNVPVYVMERCEIGEQVLFDYLGESGSHLYDEYTSGGYSGGECDIEEFLEEEFGEDFSAYIEFKEDHDITDIHEENVGLSSRGTWVLTDYSGYFPWKR